MEDIIQGFVSLLTGTVGFTSVIGTRLFPLVAQKETAYPFAIYNITADTMSKDADMYNGSLQVFYSANDYTEMIAFADVCKAVLEQEYDVSVSDPDYSSDYDAIYITINFLIY